MCENGSIPSIVGLLLVSPHPLRAVVDSRIPLPVAERKWASRAGFGPRRSPYYAVTLATGAR